MNSVLRCDISVSPTLASNSLRRTSSLHLANNNRIKSFHVCHAGVDPSERIVINGQASPSKTVQADAAALGTIAADMAPVVDGFSADDDELDLDLPTEGFSSIPEAIEDIRQGKVCPVTKVMFSVYLFCIICSVILTDSFCSM